MERKYIAFISYRHAERDSAVAKQLHTLIERYTIPRKLRKAGKKLGLVFRDEEELPISSNLSDDICTALDNAQYLIVLCSKNTCQSPWVTREIEYFLSHHDQQHTLAVLASGEPVDVFPKAITVRREPDGSLVDVEPLAIDVRADTVAGSCRKLKKEIFRLYAALIGCPYDALVQRQQRRRRRQLATVLGVVFAVVSGFLAVTLVKNHQIDLKNQELAGLNQSLEEKNDELAEQKAAVQLRESELLTEKAWTAIAAGDYQAALENLIPALPNRQEERPYYAPAEQALSQALGIYDPDRADYELFGTDIRQDSPIAAYEIHPDGQFILTLDDFGVLRCYASSDGSLRWTQPVTDDSAILSDPQLLLSPQQDCIFAHVESRLLCLNWEGEELWSRSDFSTASPLYLSPDEELLLCRTLRFSEEDWSLESHCFYVLSAQTGDILHRFDMEDSDGVSDTENGIPEYHFYDNYSTAYRACAFSSDSKLFACAYACEADDGRVSIRYILLDLETMEVRDLCSRPGRGERYEEGQLTDLVFAGEDRQLLALWGLNDGSTAARLDCIDLSDGTLLWQSDTPTEEDYPFLASAPLFLTWGPEELFVARGRHVYALDPATGEHRGTTVLRSELCSLEALDSGYHSLVCADGRYTMAALIESEAVCFDTYLFFPSLDLGPVTGAKLWNGGALDPYLGEDVTEGLLPAAREGADGYTLVQTDAQSLSVRRLVYRGDLLPLENVSSPVAIDYFLEARTLEVGERWLNIGPLRLAEEDGSWRSQFSNYVDTGDADAALSVWNAHLDELLESFEGSDPNEWLSSAGFYVQLDRLGQEDPQLIPIGSGSLLNELYFLSDNSGYLQVSAQRDLVLCYRDGREEILFKNEDLPREEDTLLDYSQYIFAQETQNDGRLLSAALGKGELIFWLDGQNETHVPLPAELNACLDLGGDNIYRALGLSANGYVLIPDYPEAAGDRGVTGRGCAVYDVAGGQWQLFALENAHSMNTAEDRPWLILVDQEGQINIYDIPSGELLHSFSPNIPLNSIEVHALVPGEDVMALLTGDGQLFLYDITDGALLFQGDTGMSDLSGSLQIKTDPAQRRLYLWETGDSSDPGLCLDMDSWTEIARIPGLLYYDSDQDLLYLCRQDPDNLCDAIFTARPLQREELVARAEELLAPFA